MQISPITLLRIDNASPITPSPPPPITYLPCRTGVVAVLRFSRDAEVSLIKLSRDSAAGHDNLLLKVIKQFAQALAHVLTHLMFRSILSHEYRQFSASTSLTLPKQTT